MRTQLTWLPAALLTILAAAGDATAQAPADKLPEEYVGRWGGTVGKGSTVMRQQKGLATVLKDFGHTIDQFAFDVAADGTVTGEGKATYWFNVSSEADLIVIKVKPAAHLVGGQQTVRFKIEGKMTPEGKLRLRSVTTTKLFLNNAGKMQTIDAWNVFGPYENRVREKDDVLEVEAIHKIPGINMELVWHVQKVDCQKMKEEIEFIEDHYLPSVEFIMRTYERAKDPAIRKKNGLKTWDDIQDWVFAEIKKKYPKAKISGRVWKSDDGKIVTKIADCDVPFPAICELTPKHEAWHARHHIPQDDAKWNALPYDEYIDWRIGSEIDAYENVNLKLAKKRLTWLKARCRRWCDASCCGK